ncbi:hypothetical protein M0812_00857 [Anaeramoeba flamelloides]|uniref:RRM domain-containing protein n=1 Tax=Anaeramoeba flamelloides TaxID=1746091 RepID=A0AAV8A3M3_9EUKA|nr:hypothetical protein M0812_00857 [Anaeramoeba flamelloides]
MSYYRRSSNHRENNSSEVSRHERRRSRHSSRERQYSQQTHHDYRNRHHEHHEKSRKSHPYKDNYQKSNKREETLFDSDFEDSTILIPQSKKNKKIKPPPQKNQTKQKNIFNSDFEFEMLRKQQMESQKQEKTTNSKRGGYYHKNNNKNNPLMTERKSNSNSDSDQDQDSGSGSGSFQEQDVNWDEDYSEENEEDYKEVGWDSESGSGSESGSESELELERESNIKNENEIRNEKQKQKDKDNEKTQEPKSQKVIEIKKVNDTNQNSINRVKPLYPKSKKSIEILNQKISIQNKKKQNKVIPISFNKNNIKKENKNYEGQTLSVRNNSTRNQKLYDNSKKRNRNEFSHQKKKVNTEERTLCFYNLCEELNNTIVLSKIAEKYGKIERIYLNVKGTAWIRFKTKESATLAYNRLPPLIARFGAQIKWTYEKYELPVFTNHGMQNHDFSNSYYPSQYQNNYSYEKFPNLNQNIHYGNVQDHKGIFNTNQFHNYQQNFKSYNNKNIYNKNNESHFYNENPNKFGYNQKSVDQKNEIKNGKGEKLFLKNNIQNREIKQGGEEEGKANRGEVDIEVKDELKNQKTVIENPNEDDEEEDIDDDNKEEVGGEDAVEDEDEKEKETNMSNEKEKNDEILEEELIWDEESSDDEKKEINQKNEKQMANKNSEQSKKDDNTYISGDKENQTISMAKKKENGIFSPKRTIFSKKINNFMGGRQPNIRKRINPSNEPLFIKSNSSTKKQINNSKQPENSLLTKLLEKQKKVEKLYKIAKNKQDKEKLKKISETLKDLIQKEIDKQKNLLIAKNPVLFNQIQFQNDLKKRRINQTNKNNTLLIAISKNKETKPIINHFSQFGEINHSIIEKSSQFHSRLQFANPNDALRAFNSNFIKNPNEKIKIEWEVVNNDENDDNN